MGFGVESSGLTVAELGFETCGLRYHVFNTGSGPSSDSSVCL